MSDWPVDSVWQRCRWAGRDRGKRPPRSAAAGDRKGWRCGGRYRT